MPDNDQKDTAEERWVNSKRGKNGMRNPSLKPWTSNQYSGSNCDYEAQYEGALIYHNENALDKN